MRNFFHPVALILLFLIATIHSLIATAAYDRCVPTIERKHVYQQNGQTLTFQKTDLNLTNKQFVTLVRQIRKELTRVDDVTPNHMRPPVTDIQLNDTSDNAYFKGGHTLWLTRQIEFPEHFEMGYPTPLNLAYFSKHPIKTNAVTHHERGHQILSYFFRNLKTSWSPMIEKAHRTEELKLSISKREKRIEEIERELKNSNAATDTPKKLSKRQKRILKELTALKDLLKKENTELEAFEAKDYALAGPLGKFIGGYHELFADLIAILTSRDADGVVNLKAMHDVLHYTGRVSKKDLKLLKATNYSRDFGVEVPLKDWSAGIHQRLNPVRFFLGNRVLSRPIFRHKEQWMVKQVAEAIVEEITFFYDNAVKLEQKRQNQDLTMDEWSEIDLDIPHEKLNRRLIVKLHLRFQPSLVPR